MELQKGRINAMLIIPIFIYLFFYCNDISVTAFLSELLISTMNIQG